MTNGIDYSGSLSIARNFTSSIDSTVFRNFSFEGTQRKNQDLSSFLYTLPLGSMKVPELVLPVSPNSVLTLKRCYSLEEFSNINQSNRNPVDVIFRATVNTSDRVVDYVIQQNVYKYISGSLHKT